MITATTPADLHITSEPPKAVTCDDFLAAMADANGADLSGVAAWYGQAGTPTLTVRGSYDAAKQTYTLTTHQATPPTNGQPDKRPVLIPLKVCVCVMGVMVGGAQMLVLVMVAAEQRDGGSSSMCCYVDADAWCPALPCPALCCPAGGIAGP